MAAAAIKLGIQDKLYIGNLDAKRDWGYAKDYVEAMWLMLQQDRPKDYIIASGENHSVKEFIELAFKELDIIIEWKGSGIHEKGYCKKTGNCIIEIDPRYFRPTEVDELLGNPSKAYKELQWKPKTSFKELVEIMVKADYNLLKNNK